MLLSSIVDCLKRFKSSDEGGVDEVTKLLQSWIAQKKENVKVSGRCCQHVFEMTMFVDV